MTIRIDGNRAAADTESVRQAVSRTQERTAECAGDRASQADRVEVSRDAQLMTAALKAAGDPMGIRPEVVERMRQLLEAGELGQDPGAIADAMIDRLLEK